MKNIEVKTELSSRCQNCSAVESHVISFGLLLFSFLNWTCKVEIVVLCVLSKKSPTEWKMLALPSYFPCWYGISILLDWQWINSVQVCINMKRSDSSTLLIYVHFYSLLYYIYHHSIILNILYSKDSLSKQGFIHTFFSSRVDY